MNRREFMGLATALPLLGGGCATAAARGPKPTRFKPIAIPGLEPRPDFWKVRPEEIVALCERAAKPSRKEVICHTPLGWPVHALFYGNFDEPAPQANWSAGSSSRTYRTYYGDRKDGVQTFLFVAGIHGAEAECVAGAVNLVQMLETGRDFRGKTVPGLLDAVSRYRFIVVPCLNMDGRAISPDHLRGLDWETFRAASQGTWKGGELIGWRGSKCWFPLPLEKVDYPGGYPNADGFNIMHDACPGHIRTAEARALLQLAERWRVDAVLNGHSYEFAPSILPPGGIDRKEKIERALDIRLRVNRRLHALGLQPRELPRGEARDTTYNLNTVLALASGALCLTLESSVSFDRPDKAPKSKPSRAYTFEELMEPTLVALEEILKDGLGKPFLVRGDETVKGD